MKTLGKKTADWRIFSRAEKRFRLFLSMSYRGARCRICSTMHDFAELNHAKFTQPWPITQGCRCHRTSSIFHFNAG